MSRSLTVLRFLLILSVFAISTFGTTVSAQSGTIVRADPASLFSNVNDNGIVSIKVDNIANLTAIEFHLSFNPAVLEVVQISNGGFVKADFSAQNTFNNTAGTIDYAIAQMTGTPAQGSGTLLNITFRAKANGISTLALRPTQAVQTGMLLSDQNGISIQASWSGGSVTVGNVATPTFTPIVPTSIPGTTIPPTNTTVAPTSTSTVPTNTSTSPTIPPTATSTPAASGANLGTHIVQSGEWLYCIGRAYKVTPSAIASANGITSPYIIYPNQKLVIPNSPWTNISTGPVCKAQFSATAPTSPTAVPTTVTATTPTATTPATSSTCKTTYTVVAGDTLYHIATQYGTTYALIASANQISNPTLIYPGQQLCIP